MLNSTKNLQNQKKEANRFLFLLLSLILIILAAPFLVKTASSAMPLNLVATIVLVSAIYEMRGDKKVLITTLVLAFVSVMLHAVFLLSQTTFTSAVDSLASIAFLGFVSSRIFKVMIQGHTITLSTIYGAMCIYLLFGILFGDIYSIIESITPGSFVASGIYHHSSLIVSRFHLITFSYAVLTTVGHSKIVTTNIVADSYVILESLIGILYLAVLIARLVTGFSSTHKDKL